ncbi:glycosyltransferase family 2 protein [Microvirga roseola]|uniref:glycosyltransferase family 2 protein n=1 Tax=Microvirga roseola TaxID=2883126 RepID=UPI001E4FDAB0|nr:glycosyltransferase family 2 protein [Microvirga roseola]
MRILAVSVTFNPNTALLAEALRSVAPQVQGLAVIDNGSANAGDVRSLATTVGAHFVSNERNLGIAAAQNQGVDLARTGGFSHILLLDQDTVLAPRTVADLSKNLVSLERQLGCVAAIGPAYFEINTQQRSRAYRSHGLRILRISLDPEAEPVASDTIIASGSLIPLKVLNKVGGFKEDLFIDLVDVEWCFRARAAGYESFLSPTVTVEHHLGSSTIKIGTRGIAVHVPVRNYYWVRNAIWLARQPYTPLAWRLYFISRSLAFLAAYTTLVDQRMLRLRLISRAIWDSLNGRFGPFGKIKRPH